MSDGTGPTRTDPGPRLGRSVLSYVEGRAARRELRPQTVETYRKILWAFADSAGPALPVGAVKRSHVERFLEHGEVSVSLVRNRLGTVRGFFAYAREHRWCRRNPCDGIKPPKVRRPVPRSLPVADVAATLAESPDARGRMAIVLMVQLGLRRGEVAELERGDVDLARGLLTVRSGKGGYSGRVLPIPAEAREAVEAYLAEHPGSAGPLLRSYRDPGRPISANYLGNLITDWMRAAGVRESSHSLRHTCASDLLDGGANVRRVQAVLGHASMQSTQRYLRWVEGEELRADVEGRRYGQAVAT